jgi:hypothetical protein
LPPRNDPDRRFGVWDELRCGADNRLGWLGRPEGPAVRLAARTPDLLAGRGRADLAEMISGLVTAVTTAEGVKITAGDENASDLRFVIRGVPAMGPDLYVSVLMQGEPMAGYPREMARFAQVGASGGMVDLLAGGPLETGMKLRGAPEEEPLDAAQGAGFQNRPREIAGRTLPAYFVHPPYKAAKGYTFWTKEAVVPAKGELRFSIGMGELSPQRSDGVRFEVHVAEVTQTGIGDYTKIFEQTTNQHEWLPQVVSLSRLAGKRLRLKFVADCGPNDNATTDHAHWGGVKLVKSGTTNRDITRPVQYMTWVNDRAFQSSFYYRHIQSPEIDLSFVVEGHDAVVVREVTAHAHADAIFRVFEGGIVLANPSLGPYMFDLSKLSPGRSYRRIQAVATQDTETNNGQRVGPTVTLGERDALFLVRVR